MNDPTANSPDTSSVLVQEPKIKKTTFGTGLLKGLAITMRHLLSRSVTVQYPDEQSPLPPRSRGVIALKEENCTVCMLCAKECPDWCIYIDGHKEAREPVVEGKRAKKFNVLDRFAIDYALCMYCGICVEVCPYDALFWSPEFEYAEYDVTGLTHEMEQLSDWMYSVPPPEELDEGAEGPQWKTVGALATASQPKEATAATAGQPSAEPKSPSPAASAPEVEQATPEVVESPPVQEAPAAGEASVPPPAPETSASQPTQGVGASQPTQGVSDEEAEEIGRKVYEEEMAKGSDPRVAEGRRKAAELRAKLGTKGPDG